MAKLFIVGLSGANKCYGFITMTDDAGARREIKALDGVHIDGRTISMRFAAENVAPMPSRQKRPRRVR